MSSNKWFNHFSAMARGANFNDSPITHVNGGGLSLKNVGVSNGDPDKSSATIRLKSNAEGITTVNTLSATRKRGKIVKRLINSSKRGKGVVRRKKKHSVAKKNNLKAGKTAKRRLAAKIKKRKVVEKDITDFH